MCQFSPVKGLITGLARYGWRLMFSLVTPYQVTVFADDDNGQCRCVRIKHCRSRRAARDFALTTLHEIYMRHIYPDPDNSERLFWCELTPCRLVKGRWQPDPAIGADCAYLDNRGEVTFDLAKAMGLYPVAHDG